MKIVENFMRNSIKVSWEVFYLSIKLEPLDKSDMPPDHMYKIYVALNYQIKLDWGGAQ